MLTMLAWGMPGLPEWIIIGAIGLLLFGKRLPEVGKSLGKGIVEFKKGLKGIDDDIEDNSNRSSDNRPAPRREQLDESNRQYRQPLAETGEDRRVSRADVIEPTRDHA